MEEKLLEAGKNCTVENLVNRINEVIGEKFSTLKAKEDIEKWNEIPKLLLLNDKAKEKLLEFVEYMDGLIISIQEKAMYIVSLAGLMKETKPEIMNIEHENLFLLADYYQNSKFKEIKQTFFMLDNEKLLFAVRMKSLDLEIRRKILSDFIEEAEAENLTEKNTKKIQTFAEEFIHSLPERDYNDVVD